MSNFNPNSSCQLYLTYTYTTKRRNIQDREHSSKISIRNINTISPYSSFSQSTEINQFKRTQRINALPPKSKIIISNSTTLNNTKRKQEAEQSWQNSSKISMDQFLPISSKRNSFGFENLDYDTIKPAFNWNKFSIFCGFQASKLGENGCLCKQPCPWKKAWTKNVHKHDLVTFKKILKERVKQSNLQQIQKDINRTHPECPTFQRNPSFSLMLKNVLVAYSIYDMQIGYVQGVNMIAGVILYHVKNAQQTFWALVEMMEYQQLRLIYLDGFKHLYAHCHTINNILMNKVYDLYEHMSHLQVNYTSFLSGWLLSLMSNSIPMQYMHQVLDCFRKTGWTYIYKLIVTYLLFIKQYLMLSQDQAEFLVKLNTKNSRQLGIQWKEMIQTADKLIL